MVKEYRNIRKFSSTFPGLLKNIFFCEEGNLSNGKTITEKKLFTVRLSKNRDKKKKKRKGSELNKQQRERKKRGE